MSKFLTWAWRAAVIGLLIWIKVDMDSVRQNAQFASRQLGSSRVLPIKPLEPTIGDIIRSIKSSVASIESDIFDLQSSVASIESDIFNLQSDIFNLQSDVSSIESDVGYMRIFGVEIDR